MLFGVISWFSHHLFRGTKLVFHLLAVANLSDPLENDPVSQVESAIDDENVLQFVLDGDQGLMRRVILADDPNVSLVEDIERRPLRDYDGVMHLSMNHDDAALTVTQQALRVRKIRP